MPFFSQISGLVLFLSFVVGQLTLHAAASPSAVSGAREALASCPSVGHDRSISSRFDVVRVNDEVWIQRLSGAVGLGSGCGG